MIDPKIRTLLKLEELGSYSKAAVALSLTQPAVSHHIKLLEQEFGIQIFVKGKRKLKATPEGEVLLKYAHRAIALSERVHRAIEDCQRAVRTLTVGITPTASDIFVPQVLAAYCHNHPETHIQIVRGSIKKIATMLKFYEIDFAIVDGILPGDHYRQVLMGTDHLCLIVSPKHPFASRLSVSLDELQREPLVLRPKSTGTRKLIEGYLVSHGYSLQDFNVMMEVDSVSTIKDIVEANLGISIISYGVCREEQQQGRLIVRPIENCRMVRQVNMVYPQDFEHPEILEEIQREYHSRVE